MKKKTNPCLKAGKTTRFFLLISLFLLFSIIPIQAYASESYAHQAVFTLHVENKTVKEVLDYIEKNSDFVILYSKDVLSELQKKISISVDNQNVEIILRTLSKEAGLKYSINDRQITVAKVATVVPDQEKITKISGQVLDENGDGIPGANVIIKGNAAQGTVTDIDGKFTIMAPIDGTLIATFIGYSPLEHSLKNKTNIIFKLLPDANQLDEIVVVGFGAQKKASVVGAVQTIKATELRSPSSTLSNSFAGRIAGVVAVQRGGEPGADGANFWIRGISTFASNTSPLVFIDNVEVSVSDLNALSPEVIEGFSILKDATATALYGARGANGVMLITTRSGKDMEKARINIRIQNSFTQPTQTVKVADGVDYMTARNNAVLNRTPNAQPYYSEEVIAGTRNKLNPYIYPNVDWEDFLFKDFSTTQSANINVTGGGQRVTYFLSGTLNNDNGMLKKDAQNTFNNNINQLRMSLQANVGVKLTSTTKANVRLNAQILDYSGSAAGTNAIYQGIFEAPPVMFAPVLPAQNGEDYILFGNRNGGPVFGRYRNPYAEMVRGYSNKNESTMIASLDLEQDLKIITQGLKMKGLVSFKNWATTNVTRSFDPYFYGIKNYEQEASGGYSYTYEAITKGSKALNTKTQNGGDRLLNYQLSLDYARNFSDRHDVGAMLVYLQRDYNENAPKDGDLYATLPVRNQGIAGRITYGFDNRYMVEANFGYNGSENFQKGKRFGFFPSVALGYNISNEDFFKPLMSVVSNLKVRGSYGKVGNSSTDSRFPYLTYVNLSGASYTFGSDWQNTGTGAIVTRYGADGARWETGVKGNVGFDLTLLNSLSVTLDWFTETREDIFMQRVIVPAESGITGDLRPYANLGKVKNEGVDLSIEYNKAFSKDLVVSLKGSLTYAKNKLLDADEPLYSENEAYRTAVGKPLNRYTGLIDMGLFKDEADIANSPEQTFSPNLKPGDIKYKDLNGDGKIDSNDMTQIGDPTVPQIVYGFGGSLQFKKFDFSLFFQGVAKTSLMMQNIHPFTSDQTTLLDFIAKDYWTEDNQNAEYPRLISNLDSHNNFMNSTFWLRSGAFLRLKNVEIGYTYKMARLFISGQNLLTFSPFKLWDPELGGGKGLTYPNLRVATIGLQLTF